MSALIQLPTNGAGTILDTRTQAGRAREIVGVGDVLRTATSRNPSGLIIYREDFSDDALIPTGWNDALGLVLIDDDIQRDGKATLRLDTQGQSNGGATSPGRTASTSGVIFKHRIHDGFRGRLGLAGWFRFTSTNLTSNTFASLSIYNRDGAHAFHGRVWLDMVGNNVPMHARILDGAATAAANPGNPTDPTATPTWYDAVTSVNQNGAGTHMYAPTTGRFDRSGGWHYVKLIVDFATGKYVSVQLDGEAIVDLSAYSLDVTDSTGFAGLHMSLEFLAKTSTQPRFMNWYGIEATLED
jgi:hypothetical protein